MRGENDRMSGALRQIFPTLGVRSLADCPVFWINSLRTVWVPRYSNLMPSVNWNRPVAGLPRLALSRLAAAVRPRS